ncbi:hypothetical protein EAF00_004354 [Botryotinia globosa]|nr:hypothetical protein EAF00_004354 [Botryotinia globosa]
MQRNPIVESSPDIQHTSTTDLLGNIATEVDASSSTGRPSLRSSIQSRLLFLRTSLKLHVKNLTTICENLTGQPPRFSLLEISHGFITEDKRTDRGILYFFHGSKSFSRTVPSFSLETLRKINEDPGFSFQLWKELVRGCVGIPSTGRQSTGLPRAKHAEKVTNVPRWRGKKQSLSNNDPNECSMQMQKVEM